MTRSTGVTAMQKADQALNNIETHERVCAIRYEGIEKAQTHTAEQLGEISSGMKDLAFEMRTALKDLDARRSKDTAGIYTRLWIFAGAIGTSMFAIIMALAFKP